MSSTDSRTDVSGGDHVVDDQHPALERRTDHDTAFAVVLRFLAIETARQILPFFGTGRSRSRPRAGCPCRPDRRAGRTRRPTPAAPSRRTARAVRRLSPSLNSPALKKYGVLRPALVTNSPNRSTSRAKREGEKFLAKIGHGSDSSMKIRRRVYSPARVPRRSRRRRYAAPLPKLARLDGAGARPVASLRNARHHPQRQRDPRRRAQGTSRAGSRASSPGTSSACRRSRRMHDDVPRALRAPRKAHVAFPPARSARATPACACTRRRPRRSRPASASREFDARGALPRGAFPGADGDQRVPAVGLERPAPAGVEVPLPRGVPAASREAAGERTRDHPVRRLEHRASQRSISRNWRSNQKNSRLPARGARVAHARVRRARLRRRVPPRRSAARSSTRGGRTAGRRGRRTSAGASTTRSRRRASRRRRTPRRSTRTGASPTTRRSSIDYDYELTA